MYLSAELIALANQQVQETFAQTSVTWQAIPHWETGDSGQTKIRQDILWTNTAPPWIGASLGVTEKNKPFNVSLAQSTVAAPDALLAVVISKTVELANEVDADVFSKIYDLTKLKETEADPELLVDQLIDARVVVEDSGYRAPSCLFVSKAALKVLSKIKDGYSVFELLLNAANINSVYRLPKPPLDDAKRYMIVLGHRQLIPHGGAASASPGEEPVDIAFSVLPSLEVVGESAGGNIELAVRTRYATRVKDVRGVAPVNP